MDELLVEGIALSRSDSGESDRRVVFLTQEFGKLSAIAKGARKASSRLIACTEPLARSRLHIVKGPRNNYIKHSIPVKSPSLRSDYSKLAAALAIAEMFSAFAVFEGIESECFDLLLKSLDALLDANQPILPLMWAGLNLLEIEGVSPRWTQCVLCDLPMKTNPATVSPSAGGMVCLPHIQGHPDSFQVRSEALIGLAKLGELAEPPNSMKFAHEALFAFSRFLEHFAHASLPALRSVVQESQR